MYLSSKDKSNLMSTSSSEDIIAQLFFTHSVSNITDSNRMKENLQTAFNAWLGEFLDLHAGYQTMEAARDLLFGYYVSHGFIIEDFIANHSSFEDITAAAWKFLEHEDSGFFHYDLFMDERHTFCQWSADWSINADSIDCVITR